MNRAAVWIGLILAVVVGVLLATVGTDVVLIAFVVVVFAAAARTRRRFVGAEEVDAPIIIPLVLFPTVAASSVFTERGVLLATWVLLAMALLRGMREKARLDHPALLIALAVAVAVPASRYQTTSGTQLWHLAAFLLLLTCAVKFPFAAVIMSLLDGVGLYLILNVVAHLAGVQSPAAVARTFALDSSTGGVRVFFPLSGSLAVPPLLAAVFVAAGLICFEGRVLRRVIRVTAFFCGVLIMVEANTRSALVIAAIVLLASVMGPRLFARMAMPLAVIPMVLPFVYPFIENVVLQPVIRFVGTAMPFLSRGSSSSDVALEGRSDIWSSAVSFWVERIDLVHRLFGYGEFGQGASGAAAVYAHGNVLLAGFSTHNSTLQQLLDGGVIGVVALVIAALGATRYLVAGTLGSSRVHLIALGALVAGILGGGTEVSQSPGYATEAFWVFAGLVLAAASRSGVGDEELEAPPTVARSIRSTARFDQR